MAAPLGSTVDAGFSVMFHEHSRLLRNSTIGQYRVSTDAFSVRSYIGCWKLGLVGAQELRHHVMQPHALIMWL